jgi:ABC-2 type transport system permease protein
MSSAIAPRHATTAVAPRNRLAGMGALLRLGLRRERLSLAIWVIAISVTVALSFPTLAALYPDAASRQAIAGGIAATPAFAVITGPVESTTLGGLTAWRYGVLGGLAAALMTLLTVIRRTRSEEESGRAELVAAGAVGRLAPLGAAVLLAGAASCAVGILTALGGLAGGQPLAGSVLLGASFAGPGLVLAAVAAIAAQLVESARAATGLAGAVLAVMFTLRAVGDTISGASFASWLSPLGWAQKLGAYGADRWPVLLLFAAATALGVCGAAWLCLRRDLGLGWWAARLGRADAPRLRSPLALAWRLQRGTLIGWSIGFLALGAMTGGMATDTEKLLAGNEKIIEIMRDLGGTGALTDVLLATMATIGGLLAAAYGISAVGRVVADESTGRAEPVLATSVSRQRFVGAHLVFALAGSAWLLLLGGVVTGLTYAGAAGEFRRPFGDGLASVAVQYPAAAVLIALSAALTGAAPRWAALAWAALGGSLLLGQLGPLLQLPQVVMDLSPFSHVPQLPAAPVSWTPLIVLALLAAVLVTAGVAGFRRRDLHLR